MTIFALMVWAAAVVWGSEAGGWHMALVVVGAGVVAAIFAASQVGVSIVDGFGFWLLGGVFGGIGLGMSVIMAANGLTQIADQPAFLGGLGASLLAVMAGITVVENIAAKPAPAAQPARETLRHSGGDI
jgi:hypothetical protein